MDFRYTYTRLNVENFQACKAFYRDVMGLSIKFEDDMDEYVEFDANSIRITLFNRKKLTDFIPTSESL
ncbi:MAG: VOC family protein, partial [Thermosynechococcaceae cyanobacterium]